MNRSPVFLPIEENALLLDGMFRHVLCPNYDTCLNEAVKKNQHFTCNSCQYKMQDIRVYKVHEGLLD